MHETALAQAVYPPPTRILGLPMKPYSIGHELQLIRESNPLLSGVGANAKREDLAQAVLICFQTFEERRRMLSDPIIPLKLWGWRWRTRKMPTGPHLQAFIDYRQNGTLGLPPSNVINPDKPPGRPSGAPFLLRLYQFVVIQLRQPIDAAWDYPLGLAQMQFATFMEEQGGFEIYNEHDAIHDEAVRALDEEEAKCRG